MISQYIFIVLITVMYPKHFEQFPSISFNNSSKINYHVYCSMPPLICKQRTNIMIELRPPMFMYTNTVNMPHPWSPKYLMIYFFDVKSHYCNIYIAKHFFAPRPPPWIFLSQFFVKWYKLDFNMYNIELLIFFLVLDFQSCC